MLSTSLLVLGSRFWRPPEKGFPIFQLLQVMFMDVLVLGSRSWRPTGKGFPIFQVLQGMFVEILGCVALLIPIAMSM